MVTKVGIVERLGESGVLLPALIDAGLMANDRLKIRLTLLQEASAQAAAPGRPAAAMEREMRSVGLADPALAAIVSGARRIDEETIFAPGAATLVAGVAEDLQAMLRPIEVAEASDAAALKARVTATLAALPAFAGDRIGRREVADLASARRGDRDTLHLLVMDLHKALNAVAAATAVETIDGARVHGLDESDRARVRAFMAGLNRTAGLAFGHPGLAATAGRVGARLTIQNDIGTTDAHVIVIHVDGLDVTTTYTDVHRVRAKFFMTLFAGQGVAFSPLAENQDNGLAGGDVFYLLQGVYRARDEEDLDRHLGFLGSRLVFLIDWNKARKALQAFVAKDDAIDLLVNAAEREDGHRGFLELGGADLVFEAVRRAAAGRIPYGVPLGTALGDGECIAFLRTVLHLASEGLRDGRSTRFIRDEIQADLSQRLDTAESELLVVVLRHLGLIRTLAGAIETTFEPGGLASLGERQSLARRAKQIEGKGDRLTVAAREIFARVRDADDLLSVIDQVENATDCFDEAAFLISLAPEESGADAFGAPLGELAAVARHCAAELARAVEAALQIPKGARADAAFTLQCVDAVLDAERDADASERAAIGALMSRPSPAGDARTLVLGIEIARRLEDATDRLAHAAMSLRNRVLQGLST
ncbi:uncharacterized protein Yka (UPF0111/DUF47 family) [Roseiarcus fermentans]|uniref:Uncharacterized protein Yka (UPF0111/DUF47 family) n=1 Tax=Roseiarcus fermentans TaxID=1473586 RepID=A0A366FBF4_9HYPH|nr:hypothetical protein [Roseiarcus fermentans]RBP11937.1 uncharacterized protein Yka (UPF0111/DUF47 family) [Roseiarcus fermentans]